MSHLSPSDYLGIIFNFLFFYFEDLVSDSFIIINWSPIICTLICCVAKLLTLTKFSNGIQLIIVDEALYQLMLKSLYLQLYNVIFFTCGRMNLIYQIRSDYKVMVHDNLRCFECPFQLGGVLGECNKHLQHHLM